LTVAEASDLVRRKAVSPVELLDAVLGRIAATEPQVHAYSHVAADLAREAAKRAEREIGKGDWRGPLHGIPLALKDLYQTADMPTEAGSSVLCGFRPVRDATVAARLRQAGVVLVGKTVTHEFAYGQNVPPTRNAWDRACYPGGSSAGAAVSVAVDSAMAGLGTDTGSSVRSPAALNGVVGLKPTFGRVSKRGVIPMSPTMDHAGPLAKTVRDCALVMNAIAGRDAGDPTTLDVPVPDFAAELDADVRGMRVGIDRGYFLYEGVTPSVRDAFLTALTVLAGLGMTVVEVQIPYLEYAVAAGLTLVMADASTYHEKWVRERASDYHPGTRTVLVAGECILATDYLRALRVRRLLRNAVRETFEAHRLTALVSPTVPSTTVPLERLAVSLTDGDGETVLAGGVHHCIPFNLTGQPALSVPCGFDEAQLPIGLQIVGRPLDEPGILRVGQAYESATDWHRRSPPV
jgi:aspartyl-tRNA(Asn)/glutamyl-tRNA(Gln) amidotransferase subunit A